MCLFFFIVLVSNNYYDLLLYRKNKGIKTQTLWCTAEGRCSTEETILGNPHSAASKALCRAPGCLKGQLRPREIKNDEPSAREMRMKNDASTARLASSAAPIGRSRVLPPPSFLITGKQDRIVSLFQNFICDTAAWDQYEHSWRFLIV